MERRSDTGAIWHTDTVPNRAVGELTALFADQWLTAPPLDFEFSDGD
jgi:hypothetical protein